MRTNGPSFSTDPRPVDTGARQRRALVIALAAGALAVVAVAWHVTAVTAYDSSSSASPTADRLADARLASTLEPWNARFGWRVVTLQGLELFQHGKVDAAFWLLEPYSLVVRGDPTYRSVYQEVVSAKAPLDARKAHVQHALEQTGGILLEKDVQH